MRNKSADIFLVSFKNRRVSVIPDDGGDDGDGLGRLGLRRVREDLGRV